MSLCSDQVFEIHDHIFGSCKNWEGWQLLGRISWSLDWKGQ